MNTINFLKKFYETTFIPSVIKKSLVGIFNDNALLKSRIIQEATGIYTLRNLSSRNYYHWVWQLGIPDFKNVEVCSRDWGLF